MIARALTIAGSDSGGGAGIQADLKTFCAFGVYGTSAVTALTAQNTVGVQDIHTPPPEFFARQLRSVLSDIPIDAAKTGMLANRELILTLVEVLAEFPLKQLVVDPVMVSKHGARLLKGDAVGALIEQLAPLAFIITPNTEEAALLAQLPVGNRAEMRTAAKRIHAMGAAHVLVKGGHLPGADAAADAVAVAESLAVDIFYDGDTFTELTGPRFDTPHTHGTGCTLSAAIAAGLALGRSAGQAVADAKEYLSGAIQHTKQIGQGISPVNHLWQTGANK